MRFRARDARNGATWLRWIMATTKAIVSEAAGIVHWQGKWEVAACGVTQPGWLAALRPPLCLPELFFLLSARKWCRVCLGTNPKLDYTEAEDREPLLQSAGPVAFSYENRRKHLRNGSPTACLATAIHTANCRQKDLQ